MINFEKEIKDLKGSGLFQKKDKILIEFSGVQDSVFLYHLLNFMKEEYEFEISLLYVNHNLRNDVDNDLEFVKEFSIQKGVKIFIEEANVLEYCKKNKKSIELGARELRYKLLEKKLEEINYNKIATGHNLDDNVETLIFRLLRGTSIKGMKGIPSKRENIIRPILQFEKKEILQFLNEKNEKYLRDYTNNENDYTRNYIRNEIFPMFLNVNKNFKNKVNELILEINEYEKNKKITEKDRFIKLFKKNNVEISRNKINQMYNDIFNVDGTIKNEGSKEYHLGNNKILRKNYDKLEIIEKYNTENKNKSILIKQNQSIEWYTYEVMLLDYEEILKSKIINQNDLFFRIDENLLKLDKKIDDSYNIIVRQRKDGDVIKLNNLGHKKVKKILIDEKVLKWERDEVPIIEAVSEKNKEFNNEILMVSHIKISKYIKKISYEKLNYLKKSDKILIIRRKNGR